MTWAIDDPQGDEAAKIKYLAVPYTRGVVLDMGCGPKKAFPHFLGVDSCKDTELFGIPIKPDIKLDVADPAAVLDNIVLESADAVFSSHCLEHIEDYKEALKAWWACIKVGGYLVLYLPDRELYPNIGERGANPDHKHDFDRSDIVQAMYAIGAWFELLENEQRDEDYEYSFYQVYRKLAGPPILYNEYVRPHKSACVCRYGGIGDQIQASGILPELKRQGYHVTFMTTPKGKNILEHDPHIDEWILQDTDQVPNHELYAYWSVWAKRFDKFVNLSESVEGTLLAMPGRANHAWSNEVRHKRLNTNYGEWTAELAGLDYYSEAHFYPDSREIIGARHRLRDFAGTDYGRSRDFVIMWVLSGSSLHKTYPWQDSVIAAIMTELPHARVITVGDFDSKLLEQGWENEPRMLLLSGQISIRDTLALALQCDCVVGPETGVLNAVAFEHMRKVVLLSHSSEENLTKHWTNTVALSGHAKTPCEVPCHRLHYDDRFCPRDEGEFGRTALCMQASQPGETFEAIADAYFAWDKPTFSLEERMTQLQFEEPAPSSILLPGSLPKLERVIPAAEPIAIEYFEEDAPVLVQQPERPTGLILPT